MTKKIDSRFFDEMMRNPLTFLMGLSQLAQQKSNKQPRKISQRNRTSINQSKTR